MSKQRRIGRAGALTLVASMLAAFAQIPAHAAAPGTVVMIDSNNDGYLTSPELDGSVQANWTHTDPAAASAKVWFQDRNGNIPAPGGSGCGKYAVGIDGNGALNADCAVGMPEGPFKFVAQWFNASAVSLGTAEASLIKDTLTPGAPNVTAGPATVAQPTVKAVTVRVSTPGETAIDANDTARITIDDTDTLTAAIILNKAAPGGIVDVADLDVTSLKDGTLTITAQITDGPGHVGGVGTTTIQKDTVGPGIPVINTPAVSTEPYPRYVTVSGIGDPNTDVQILDGPNLFDTLKVDAKGKWSKKVQFLSGTHSLTAVGLDEFKNAGAASPVRTFDVDAIDPTLTIESPNFQVFAPSDAIAIGGAAKDLGLSTSQVIAVKITLFDARGVQIGCLKLPDNVCVPVEPGNPTPPTVRVGRDLTPGAEATCAQCKKAANVTWSYAVSDALPPGYYTVTAQAIDRAGNGSTALQVNFLKL